MAIARFSSSLSFKLIPSINSDKSDLEFFIACEYLRLMSLTYQQAGCLFVGKLGHQLEQGKGTKAFCKYNQWIHRITALMFFLCGGQWSSLNADGDL
jgi:hypothetical protein